MQAGPPKAGRHVEEEGDARAGQRPLELVLRGRGASAAAHSSEEGRARAGPGWPAGPPALRSLPSGAAEPELRVPAAGSLLVLPRRSAPRCRQGRAGQGRAGQGRAGCGSAGLAVSLEGLLLCFPLQQEGAAGGGAGGGCPGPLLCGGARPLPRRQGRRAPAAAGRSLGSPWQPSAGRTARCRGPSR